MLREAVAACGARGADLRQLNTRPSFSRSVSPSVTDDTAKRAGVVVVVSVVAGGAPLETGLGTATFFPGVECPDDPNAERGTSSATIAAAINPAFAAQPRLPHQPRNPAHQPATALMAEPPSVRLTGDWASLAAPQAESPAADQTPPGRESLHRLLVKRQPPRRMSRSALPSGAVARTDGSTAARRGSGPFMYLQTRLYSTSDTLRA